MSDELKVPRGAEVCPKCGASLSIYHLPELDKYALEPTVFCQNKHFWWRNHGRDDVKGYWIEAPLSLIR